MLHAVWPPCQALRARGHDMARKSSITRGPEEVQATINKLIRQGRLTLDEIHAYVDATHGAGTSPSRSALGRYAKSMDAMMGRMRDIDAASRAIVEELGESPDDKAGALLVQSITTAATDVALRMHEAEGDDAPSVEDVRKLARAGSDIMRARKVSRQERQEIARLARDKLLEEQGKRLDAVSAERGMDETELEFWRKKILGIG